MSERICGRCGNEAAGFASVWTAKTGDVPYCHGDDDDEPTCYQRGEADVIRDQSVPLSIALDWPPAAQSPTPPITDQRGANDE